MPDKCPVCGRFTKIVRCPEAELGFGAYCSNCKITGRARRAKRTIAEKKRDEILDSCHDDWVDEEDESESFF